MIIQVCVGSSCHLKGSEKIVELFQEYIKDYHLEDEVTLAGNFCVGQCNRVGVTVQIDDEIFTGVSKEMFHEFFADKVLSKIRPDDKSRLIRFYVFVIRCDVM